MRENVMRGMLYCRNDMNFRVNLGMTRDVPILRIKRAATGTNIRGSKPVTVYFQKYEDKEEILR